jgi:hypothetical protein
MQENSLFTPNSIPVQYKQHFQLQDEQYTYNAGKTFNYKISYKNINKMFLLPAPDQIHQYVSV